MLNWLKVVTEGPFDDQPVRSGRLTNSAARTNVALFIHRAVRPLTPPGVGTSLRADGLPGRRHHALKMWSRHIKRLLK